MFFSWCISCPDTRVCYFQLPKLLWACFCTLLMQPTVRRSSWRHAQTLNWWLLLLGTPRSQHLASLSWSRNRNRRGRSLQNRTNVKSPWSKNWSFDPSLIWKGLQMLRFVWVTWRLLTYAFSICEVYAFGIETREAGKPGRGGSSSSSSRCIHWQSDCQFAVDLGNFWCRQAKNIRKFTWKSPVIYFCSLYFYVTSVKCEASLWRWEAGDAMLVCNRDWRHIGPNWTSRTEQYGCPFAVFMESSDVNNLNKKRTYVYFEVVLCLRYIYRNYGLLFSVSIGNYWLSFSVSIRPELIC